MADVAVHFVGFRHDREVDLDNDTIVFGSKARPDVVNRYNGNDIDE